MANEKFDLPPERHLLEDLPDLIAEAKERMEKAKDCRFQHRAWRRIVRSYENHLVVAQPPAAGKVTPIFQGERIKERRAA